MRVLEHHDPYPTSPSHVRPLSLTNLDHLFFSKALRSYSVDSRESTPEVYNSQFTFSPLDHWKNLASHNERLIRSLGVDEDYRTSIPSPEYWRIQAEWLDTIYWKLREQRRTRVSSKSSKPDDRVDLSNCPVSSRLRSRHKRPFRPSNPSMSQICSVAERKAQKKTHVLRCGIRKQGSRPKAAKGQRSRRTV